MILDPFVMGVPAGFFTRLRRYLYPVKNQQSAGTVLINNKQTLLIHRGDFYNDWTFPKGKVENEDWETAAIRETIEEVGIKPKIGAKLTPNRYSFYSDENKIRVNNTVYYFLAFTKQTKFKLTGNVGKKEASTFLEAKWFTINKAISVVKHDREREMLLEVKRLFSKYV